MSVDTAHGLNDRGSFVYLASLARLLGSLRGSEHGAIFASDLWDLPQDKIFTAEPF